MIHLTKAAQDKLLAIIKAQTIPDMKYVRVGVRGGGCSGFEYNIALISEFEIDWICNEYWPDSELKVFVDPISYMYIDETKIDYIESLTESGFKFDNPKTSHQCGCGKSFSV